MSGRNANGVPRQHDLTFIDAGAQRIRDCIEKKQYNGEQKLKKSQREPEKGIRFSFLMGKFVKND
ncbi:MAG: hypothetical protein KH197_03690 [Clostridiales bacterium]|nr:hypothetical protein [Clostridiales bacterium]